MWQHATPRLHRPHASSQFHVLQRTTCRLQQACHRYSIQGSLGVAARPHQAIAHTRHLKHAPQQCSMCRFPAQSGQTRRRLQGCQAHMMERLESAQSQCCSLGCVLHRSWIDMRQPFPGIQPSAMPIIEDNPNCVRANTLYGHGHQLVSRLWAAR